MKEVIFGLDGNTLGFILFEIGGFMTFFGMVRNKIPKSTKFVLRVIGIGLCIVSIILCKAYQ